VTFNANAPVGVGAPPARNRIDLPIQIERTFSMRHVRRNHQSFKSTPLGRAAGARRFRDLPYPAKRLARQIGCEPELANLIAELAGLKGGRL